MLRKLNYEYFKTLTSEIGGVCATSLTSFLSEVLQFTNLSPHAQHYLSTAVHIVESMHTHTFRQLSVADS